MFRFLAIALLVVSFNGLAATNQTDFQTLTPVLKDFRSGTGDEVAIRLSRDSFTVRRLVTTELDAQRAKALMPEKKPLGTLRITEDGTWIERRLDDSTTLDEPIGEKQSDKERSWKKHVWESLATFDRAAWPRFVEYAIENGLCGFEETRYEGGSSLALSFAPATPDRIEAGGRTLALNDEFAAVMRLSPRYPPKTGQKGFVILLHDPHENVAGRFQTLTGLRSFLLANSSVSFRFLVEGAYQGPSRVIGFSGLDKTIRSGSSVSAAIVHRLLSQYVINTPLAYRLLFDRRISAYAIDNNELLAYPAPRPIRSVLQQINSLEKLSSDLEKAKLPAEAAEGRSKLNGLINTAFIFLTANLRDAPDAALVEYYGTLADLYQSIFKIGRIFSQAGVELSAADLRGLAADAAGCSDEAAIYQKALGRNKTMAPLIIEAATALSQPLPIAFIGSYHTKGILTELDKASVGYVVIEPRPRHLSTEQEHARFDRANHANKRTQYLAGVALNMGYTVPTQQEVQTYVVPKIAMRITQLRAEQATTELEFQRIPGATIDLERLTAATSSNGYLGVATIASGGNLPPPPPRFGAAFAYFDPDGGNNGPASQAAGGGFHGGSGKGRLVILSPADARWKDSGRYDFMSIALFASSERSDRVSVGTKAAFYPVGGRLFFTTYDPESKRTYCYEGSPQQAAMTVTTPIGNAKGEQNIRMQLSELIIIVRVKDNG